MSAVKKPPFTVTSWLPGTAGKDPSLTFSSLDSFAMLHPLLTSRFHLCHRSSTWKIGFPPVQPKITHCQHTLPSGKAVYFSNLAFWVFKVFKWVFFLSWLFKTNCQGDSVCVTSAPGRHKQAAKNKRKSSELQIGGGESGLTHYPPCQ